MLFWTVFECNTHKYALKTATTDCSHLRLVEQGTKHIHICISIHTQWTYILIIIMHYEIFGVGECISNIHSSFSSFLFLSSSCMKYLTL